MLKIVLCVFVAVCLVSGTAASIYINSLLDKVTYEDEINMSVDPNLEEDEDIDFSLDEEEPSQTEVADSADKGNITKPSTTKKKKKKTSDTLVSIQKVENGVVKDYQVDEDKLKEEAAAIQQEADKDIAQNITKDTSIWYSDDVYNLLIIGFDAGEDEAVMFEGMKYPRSDCIIIASINKKQKTLRLVSLSRATYVAIRGHGNKRLNTAHAFGGARALRETIESNYKIKINSYVAVDFKGFSNIINAMNGVSVDLSAAEANFAFNKEGLTKGNYTLNGKQALRFVRLREIDSDRQRTGRQRKVLTSIYDKFKGQTLTQKLDFMDVALPYVMTDLSKAQIIQKITESQNYVEYKLSEDIIPHNAIKLTLKEGKEVIILDWDETTDYIHKLLYTGADVKKIEVKPITQ